MLLNKNFDKRLTAICLFVFLIVINLTSADNPPKNIIFFISDGMGYNQVLATNYYLTGKAQSAIYENFPIQLSMATYNGIAEQDKTYTQSYCSQKYWSDFEYAKQGATDSGAAATSLSTGRKTFLSSIGMNYEGKPLYNLTTLFKDMDKAAGVITSVQFSHATPAGFVAHSLHRDNFDEIAPQMIDSRVDVIMSAAHPYFTNDGTKADVPNYKYYGGIAYWEKVKNGYNDRVFVEKKEDFEKFARGNAPARVFGAAQTATTLQQERSKNEKLLPGEVALNKNVPTLETMTLAALNSLANNQNGFFIMIEGGAVDWAGHDNNTGRMIEEMTDFNKSVEAAVKWVETYSNWDETLMIVTSDHECGYLLGPNQNDNNPLSNPVVNNGKGKLPGVTWNHSDHTNVLVPFYAKGSNATKFLMYAYAKDIVYGYYIQNVHIPLAIFNMYGMNPISINR